MNRIPIGQFIRERRESMGITQEMLCGNICDVTTLSRIENGKAFPRNTTLHDFLERLGVPDSYYTVPMDEYENHIRLLRKEARARVVAFQKAAKTDRAARREEALSALQELEDLAEKDDFLTRQRVLSDRTTLGTPEGPYPVEKHRELLLEALGMTVSGFDISKIDDFRYTQEETELINKIAITYVLEGNRETAISIYRQLLDYIQENNQQLSRYSGQLTMIAFNYSRELGISGHYANALAIAELGRKTSVQYVYYQFLPGLLHIMAECQHYLGNDESSKELYCQAFNVYKAFEEWNDLETLKKDALEQLGYRFP